MTIFGRKIDSIARTIGKKFDYNSVHQFGNKVAHIADKTLHAVDKYGGITSNILGKAATVANGLGLSPIGAGLNLAKTAINVGRKGVAGLEKQIDIAKSVGSAIDKNHNTFGKAIMSGDTNAISGAIRDVTNPLKQF